MPHHYKGSINYDNVISKRPLYSLIGLQGWIDDEGMARNRIKISIGPKSLGCQGCTTQYIPALGSVRIH